MICPSFEYVSGQILEQLTLTEIIFALQLPVLGLSSLA